MQTEALGEQLVLQSESNKQKNPVDGDHVTCGGRRVIKKISFSFHRLTGSDMRQGEADEAAKEKTRSAGREASVSRSCLEA